MIAGSSYFNVNSDEDDMQGWGLGIQPWETVDGGPHNKRIRINLDLWQWGQATLFGGIQS